MPFSPIHCAQLRHAYGQLAVRVLPALVHSHVEGAVHGLQLVLLILNLGAVVQEDFQIRSVLQPQATATSEMGNSHIEGTTRKGDGLQLVLLILNLGAVGREIERTIAAATTRTAAAKHYICRILILQSATSSNPSTTRTFIWLHKTCYSLT